MSLDLVTLALAKKYTDEKAGGGGSDYKLPIGGEKLGGVKNGGNVVINADGTMTAPEAGSIKITGTENSKIAPTGTILDNGTEIHLVSQEIRVNPGEQYLLTCSANFGNSLYAIYDSNGTKKENLEAPATEEGRSEVDLPVTIPSGGAILRVAWNKQVTDTPYAVTKVGNAVVIPKSLDGVTVAVIGDSLVERNNSAKVNFVDLIAAETGATVTNLGVGGTGYMAGADESKAFYQRAAQIPEGTDRVLIYGSGNDRNMPLGNPTDTGTDTLCGCINATIDAVYERVPTAWVGIIAPAPWKEYPPYGEKKQLELMVQAQQRICARRGIPFLDLYHASGLRPWDDTFRELAFDEYGVHPNDTGHALIAPQIQAFLLGAIGGGAVASVPDSSQNVNIVPVALKDGDYNVLAINHRGYCTVAPENTIPAYILSKEKGYNYVECDVSFTSDGVAVLLHDGTIDRTSDGTGNISEMTYAEALQYDFGSWKSSAYAGTKIPTFEEFIRLCKNVGLHPYIELKSNGAYTEAQIASIVDTVKRHRMQGNVTYISFNYDYLVYVKNADASARLGWVVYGIDNDWMVEIKALRTGSNEVFIDQSSGNVTDTSINLCIANDVPVEIWTVNSAEVIENMNPYISGVTSDSLNAGKVLHDMYMTYTPPEVEDMTLTSISATYNGGDVAVGTDVNSLSGVVVTGTYSNGTTSVISGYTLSGQIAEGENTITVTYGELTTTFKVTGVAESSGGDEGGGEVDTEGLLHYWDFTQSLSDLVGDADAEIPTNGVHANKAYQDNNGLHIEADRDFAQMLGVFGYNRTYEIDVGAVDAQYGTSAHGRLFTTHLSDGYGMLIYRCNTVVGWQAYSSGWNGQVVSNDVAAFANKTVKITVDGNGNYSYYVDGTLLYAATTPYNRPDDTDVFLGSAQTAAYNTIIKAMRIYEGVR